MKTFSRYITEAGCTTADVNQGNSLLKTGVTNHLTPIGNIVTNVKNLFATRLGIVASVAEDGVSIKLNSSYFTDEASIRKVLYNSEIMRDTCLYDYIISQGLTLMKIVNVGQFCVVYFCPTDIASSEPGAEPEQQNLPCTEQYNFEAEMINIIKEDDDEELEDITKKKLKDIFTSKDKVKAAKQLELLVSQEIELPREYYFAGVKDKSGNESIALRWKYTKRAGRNQTTEVTKSILNIYDDSKEAVFVSDFCKDSMFTLPDEVKKLIENVLEFIGAEKTSDECVYSLDDKDSDKDKDKDDKSDKDDNKKESDKSSEDKDKKESDKNDKSNDTDDLL